MEIAIHRRIRLVSHSTVISRDARCTRKKDPYSVTFYYERLEKFELSDGWTLETRVDVWRVPELSSHLAELFD